MGLSFKDLIAAQAKMKKEVEENPYCVEIQIWT